MVSCSNPSMFLDWYNLYISSQLRPFYPTKGAQLLDTYNKETNKNKEMQNIYNSTCTQAKCLQAQALNNKSQVNH